MTTVGARMLTNSGKCPLVHNGTFEGLNGSSTSAQKEDESTFVWHQNMSIELRNYQTGASIKVHGPTPGIYEDCRHHVCTSTLMSLTAHAHGNKSSNVQRTEDIESNSINYIRKETYDFLSIYHEDKGTSNEDYEKRIADIDHEIQQTGTYAHTTAEIEYGCQLAWRNSARCINRLYWSTLKVVDRRQVKTNGEMFTEICNHLRMAYNNGTLQATTLVMPKDARLWSTQYLRYACYEQADGSILGDPANRELTKVAIELGWNNEERKRTQWDLLPIIVQCDPNTPPSWYNLPEDLRPTVMLSHPDPKYDAAIKSLGLRWVAQPFVADKAIEIGGIVYKCVPFSGWFMETEIGRNLCDIQRYNIIPKLAALLNLDVTAAANSQLNIDRIYVEINAAVLHSFQKAKVAIVDHHTAATGFMKFMNQEVKQRGNTPADWIWLVPPISGGMSSLFHQEMLNYVVKPRVLDQRDPWTYYAPFLRNKKVVKMSAVNKRRHRWLVLRAACVIVGFGLRAMQKRVSVTVLYASASGTAQSYAQQMTKRLTIDGYGAKLMQLDAFSFQQPTETRSIVLIITSTFGQGNASEGGEKVEEWLQKEVNTDDDTTRTESMVVFRKPSQSNKTSLKWCTYAVCAIGSSAYPFFCGFGKLVDRAFALLGAHRLAPLATCDALNQQYKTYNEWEETTLIALKKMYPHTSSNATIKALPSSPIGHSPLVLRPVSYVEEQVSLNISVRPTFIPLRFYSTADERHQSSKQAGPFTKENPYNAVVEQNIELTGVGNSTGDLPSQNGQQYSHPTNSPTQSRKVTIPSNFTIVNNDEYRSVRLIILKTPDLSYYPGDHVCILPENTLANVNGVILACGWQLGNKLLNDPCSLESLTDGKYKTIRQILTNFVDLASTPRPHTLNTIATYATNPNEQRRLLELGKGGRRYTDWLVNLPTIKEMLDQFPSIKIPIEELIQVKNVEIYLFFSELDQIRTVSMREYFYSSFFCLF